MNENLSYNGAITLIHRFNNKEVSRKFYNKGTINLFEAYARAMCGQSISRFLPSTLDVGSIQEGEFITKIKNGVTIPVLTTYKSEGTDGGVYKDNPNDNSSPTVPYCRVSATLFSDMFNAISESEQLIIVLKSRDGNSLAEVNVSGLSEAIAQASSTIQLVLLWDLYITNGGN